MQWPIFLRGSRLWVPAFVGMTIVNGWALEYFDAVIHWASDCHWVEQYYCSQQCYQCVIYPGIKNISPDSSKLRLNSSWAFFRVPDRVTAECSVTHSEKHFPHLILFDLLWLKIHPLNHWRAMGGSWQPYIFVFNCRLLRKSAGATAAQISLYFAKLQGLGIRIFRSTGSTKLHKRRAIPAINVIILMKFVMCISFYLSSWFRYDCFANHTKAWILFFE